MNPERYYTLKESFDLSNLDFSIKKLKSVNELQEDSIKRMIDDFDFDANFPTELENLRDFHVTVQRLLDATSDAVYCFTEIKQHYIDFLIDYHD